MVFLFLESLPNHDVLGWHKSIAQYGNTQSKQNSKPKSNKLGLCWYRSKYKGAFEITIL